MISLGQHINSTFFNFSLAPWLQHEADPNADFSNKIRFLNEREGERIWTEGRQSVKEK